MIMAIILVLFILGCSSKDITGNVVKDIEETTEIQQEAEPIETGPSTCEETDDGIDIEYDGKVSGLINGKVYNYVDRCIGPFLVEYYCKDNKPLNKNIRCNCLSGECV